MKMSDHRREPGKPRNVMETIGDHIQPIQVIEGEVTVNNNRQTVTNNNSCSPLVMMAILGYTLVNCTTIFLCRKGNNCYCCSTIVYNEAKTAVLKLSVIKQIGLAAVGVLIPGAIAGGVLVTAVTAPGVLLPTKG